MIQSCVIQQDMVIVIPARNHLRAETVSRPAVMLVPSPSSVVADNHMKSLVSLSSRFRLQRNCDLSTADLEYCSALHLLLVIFF